MEKNNAMSNEANKISALFQEICHREVANTILNQSPETGEISYQDATNVWIFDKLADLQYQINKIIRREYPIKLEQSNNKDNG